jgi:asparagine synthase (glutamine-hydrolysing)
MCGFAGIVNFSGHLEPPSIDRLKSMIAMIRHRGPDEYGMYRDAHAGMVHARLSIIDILTGQQPMSNEDQTLWIVFNGEIFNFIELRAELENAGHRFKTRSDTEVILHAYETWGAECFCRFNGQWSIAMWDKRKTSLILSRDRIGIRPLYIHENSGRIRFASEIKAIFADPSVPRSLDLQGLDQTFTYWASLAPITLFNGIEELPPASVRIYDKNGDRKEWIYWTPSYPEKPRNWDINSGHPALAEAVEILKEKLEQATKLRMLRSDVPVGSYLSGGIDSSLVAKLGRQSKAGRFDTFSVRFDDAEFDETGYQRMMADTLDSTHKEILITKKDIAEVFPDVIWHTERPVLRTAPAPLYLLSKLVREAGIKVVLTGEGADEILAGYDLFREAKIRRFWSNEPTSKIRPLLFDRIYPYLTRAHHRTKRISIEFWKKGIENADNPCFSHEPRWSTTAGLKRFLSDDIMEFLKIHPPPNPVDKLPPAFHKWEPLSQAQYLEISTLLSSYLISSQGDRMLMANSVEGRFPFLDADVVEFCNNLPAEYKLAFLDEKHILKKLASGLIPEQIVQRKKQPYRAPDAASFLHRNAPGYIEELFSEERLKKSGIFNEGSVRTLYEKCMSKKDMTMKPGIFSNTDNMSFVGILSTQLVIDQFIENFDAGDSSDIRFNTCIDCIPHF